MTPDNFYSHYRNNGFSFENSLLTRYCLSLYSKPFVLLSGISGTGKTKIAQLFNTLENHGSTEIVQQHVPRPQLVNRIVLSVTQGVLDGDRGNFRFSDLVNLFEQDEITNIRAQIETKRQESNEGNIIDPVNMIIEGEQGEELTIAVYLQRASSPLLRVRFKSKRGDDEEFDSSVYMRNHYVLNDVLELEKVGRHRFRIASVNNAEIIRINEVFEREAAEQINNSLFISVKSNWTDSTELFGHYNMLNDKYQMTDLLRFIITAHDYPRKPFFLILDEMNLSKVEYYFSDFLSSLESRYVEGGQIKQEPITLHNFGSSINSDDDLFDSVPSKVELPTNLYVTGTVNIDETTYMFSPKVLDRANVIEFNEVSLRNYTEDVTTPGNFRLTRFPDFGISEIASMNHFNESPESFKRMTGNLLEILKPYNLHFGYRVINEMAMFMKNVQSIIGNSDEIINYGIDVQISQKVLPKLNGAYGKLDEPLRKLISLLLNNEIPYNEITLERLNSIQVNNYSFKISLQKLIRMYQGLMKNGFTSYLE